MHILCFCCWFVNISTVHKCGIYMSLIQSRCWSIIPKNCMIGSHSFVVLCEWLSILWEFVCLYGSLFMPPKVGMLKLHLPSVCVSASTFHVWAIFFSCMDWLQNNLSHVFDISRQCVAWKSHVPTPSVFVTISLCYN